MMFASNPRYTITNTNDKGTLNGEIVFKWSAQSDLHYYTINWKDSATETWRRDDESESGDV
jgi:hypothetical protein